MVLGLMGVLFLTRSLGPYDYGIYAVALGVATWMQTLGDWGVSVYLVRADEERMDRVEASATTVLLALGLAGTALGLALLIPLGHLLWTHAVVSAAVVLVASTPLVLAAQVPIARLDRELAFRQVAVVEIASQLTLYAVGIPLVLLGAGPWGPTLGMVASRGVLLVGAAVATRWRPRLLWDRQIAKDVLGYGFGYSASVTVWQLRALALPFIVAPLAGPAIAGQVALAVRLVEIAGFIRAATWRLALAALARVQHDSVRTCRAVRDGAVLQVMALGGALGGLALLSGPVIETVFGPKWTPLEKVFPLIALGAVANGAFNLHASALYARRRNWAVTWFHVGHVTLFLGGAAAAVSHFGLVGYGVAELIALPAYALLVRSFKQSIGSAELAVVLPWLAAALGILATPLIGPGSLLLLLTLLAPRCRVASRALVASVLATVRGRSPWRPRSAF